MTTKPRAATKPPARPAAKTAADELFVDFPLREGSAPRHMRVRIPSAEQLAVWQSIGETFTRLGAEWAYQSALVADLPDDHPDAVGVRSKQNRQAIRGVNRSIKLIKSVLADEADHEWVDDMVMEGATIEELLGIVTYAVAAMRSRSGAAPKPAAAVKAELTE
jgi:hypothetical protein